MIPKLILVFILAPLAYCDLYNSSDPMVILNDKNFYKTILSSKNGWVIEFYNSWCGHCIEFAAKWREFSKEIKDWNHTIKAAVLDCSDEENASICRDYEIMKYPSIRLFGSYTPKNDFGKNIGHRSIKEMKKEVVHFIIEKEENDLANNIKKTSSWVNLLSYKGLIKDIFKEASPEVKNAVLIVEKRNSEIASHSILDLGKFPMVYVRRISSHAAELKKFKLNTFPSVLVIPKDGNVKVLMEHVSTHEEVTALVIHHLKLTQGLAQTNSLHSFKPESIEGAGDGNPEEINMQRLNYDDELPDSAFNIPEQVYMVDIENGISYALRHEVSLHKILEGETLNSLKSFVSVLVKYMPFRPPVLNFMRKLQEYLSHKNSLQGADLEKTFKLLESPDTNLPYKQPWRSCLGSDSKYRGYPCSLWLLFHTLTVNAFIQKDTNRLYVPLEPLKAIHGYVKTFFSCEYCSKHFQEMYKEDAETLVKNPGDEVLWLWKAHNKVSKRIKGDLSEDPKHPKEQFPSKAVCPKCWSKEEGQFSTKEVLEFLKKIYSKNSLSLEGTQNLFPDDGDNFKNKSYNKQPANQRALIQTDDKYNKSVIKETNVVKIQKLPTTSWSFNSTDLNLCVILYLTSTFIIAAGYFMFMLKRRMRRKKFLEYHKMP